ncbi:MAG: hypothetical protein SFU25_05805 [Candidatus Caenarcaniphilales bacterium]|nr:hypothetical protein [Candidatus Caenarcaniphilales bacterium]
MGISSLGRSLGPSVFHLRKQTSNGNIQVIPVGDDQQLAELIAAVQNGQTSSGGQSSQPPTIYLIQTPAPQQPQTIVQSRSSEGSAPWPVSLVMRAIDLAAILFLAGLAGTFGMKLLNNGGKWFSGSHDGKNLWETKFSNLPQEASEKLETIWKGVSDKYKSGKDSNQELTLGHFKDALEAMFKEGKTDEAYKLLGQIHTSLDGHFNKVRELLGQFFGFKEEGNIHEQEITKPRTLVILDNESEQILKDKGIALEKELFQISEENSPKAEKRRLKTDLKVEDQMKFINALRTILQTPSAEIQSIKGYQNISLRLTPFAEYSDIETLKTYLSDTEKSSYSWSELAKAVSVFAENLIEIKQE